jgi:squalene cyclase
MKSILHLTMTLAAMAAISRAQSAGPVQADTIRAAVEKALPSLQKAGPVFAKKTGCVSCHHQSLPLQATAMASQRDYNYDYSLDDQQVDAVLKVIEPAREVLAEGSDVIPEIPATASYILMALHDQGYQPNELTAAVVHNIAMKQRPDGSWTGFAIRPPIVAGDIRETALALHGLDMYSPLGRRAEMNQRIAKARAFLLKARPATPEESIMRLMGLAWAGTPSTELRDAADAVLALQRPDGGWAQLTTRESDAYATGEALLALHRAGVLTTGDAAYQRGLRFLLTTQEADGSWHVKTRAYPFQPLIDTTYPHGRDQWISAAGTSQALMALMLADPLN